MSDICSSGCVLGFDDDATLEIPCRGSAIKFTEQPLVFRSRVIGCFRLINQRGTKLLEPFVPADTYDILDLVRFAPAEHFPPAESVVAAEDDLHVRPGLAYTLRQQGKDRPRVLCPIDLRGPQVGAEQMRAAKNIDRKEAVVVKIAVKEAASSITNMGRPRVIALKRFFISPAPTRKQSSFSYQS
ncbi:hypothetical protein P4E94_16785 [Pontiellaceae bacterium B12219]|nr:hypothetical protein [Pontiellaceae bacterium B12219]